MKTRYVIKDLQGYIQLDQHSGGYPYRVHDPLEAKLWDDIEGALNYIQVVKNMLHTPRVLAFEYSTKPIPFMR